MKRRDLVLTLILASSFSLVAGPQLFTVGEANFMPLPELPPPVYIRSDGSIEPSSVPLQQIGNTYTFTNNINNTIEVQRSNIVLNGNGYTLKNPSVETQNLVAPIGWLPGIHVADISNVTVTNIAFEGCITGTTVKNSSNITVSHNTIRETLTGIVVSSSSFVSIVGNDIALMNRSFASGIVFLPGSPQESVPRHIRIEANCIVGNSQEVPNIALQPEQYGIWGGFRDSEMTKNTLTNIKGIALYNIGADNRIVSNNFQENYEGILINTHQGVWFNNFIYGNNFNHNSENVVVAFIRNPPVNFWCNRTVGNYWSNYNGTDANGDGIGDSPYIIETTYTDYEQFRKVTVEEGRDNYPSMTPFDIAPVDVELLTQRAPSLSTPLTDPQTTEPFPKTLIVTASVFTVSVVGINLLIYFKKRKRGLL
jgi:nitrous oxidase accessory protein NosD